MVVCMSKEAIPRNKCHDGINVLTWRSKVELIQIMELPKALIELNRHNHSMSVLSPVAIPSHPITMNPNAAIETICRVAGRDMSVKKLAVIGPNKHPKPTEL